MVQESAVQLNILPSTGPPLLVSSAVLNQKVNLLEGMYTPHDNAAQAPLLDNMSDDRKWTKVDNPLTDISYRILFCFDCVHRPTSR